MEWLYSLSQDELYNYKEKQFLRIFRKAYRHSTFYSQLYRKHGIAESDIKSLSDIAKLPVLTKDIVKQHGKDMLTVPEVFVSRADTSGTTGTPLTAYLSYKAIRLEQAFNWCRRKNSGFIYGKDRLLSLRGHLGAKRFRAYVSVSNTLYLSAEQITDELAVKYFEEIGNFKPIAIEGYPSTLYNLALSLDRNDLKLTIPKAFTSSETLFPFQRKVIERVFGTELFDRYGCTERCISFSEQIDHLGYYEDPGYGHTEIFVDHVLATSLINDAFPLIRYRVNDVLIKGSDGYIESIEGRTEDVIVCKDGAKISRLNNVLKGVSGIAFVQIVQKVKGEIEVRYVPDSDFSSNSITQIENGLHDKIEKSNIDIAFIEVDEDRIIYTSRNKFSFVKSYLDSFA